MNSDNQQDRTTPLAIRKGEVSDLAGIASLFRKELGRDPDLNRIGQYLLDFPSAIAESDEFGLVAFAFTTNFAPDILELANILVASEWRDYGLGSLLLAKVEALAKGCFGAIILVNSMLYSSVGKKRSAAVFYTRAGYESILQTPDSVVFGKLLSDG